MRLIDEVCRFISLWEWIGNFCSCLSCFHAVGNFSLNVKVTTLMFLCLVSMYALQLENNKSLKHLAYFCCYLKHFTTQQVQNLFRKGLVNFWVIFDMVFCQLKFHPSKTKPVLTSSHKRINYFWKVINDLVSKHWYYQLQSWLSSKTVKSNQKYLSLLVAISSQ